MNIEREFKNLKKNIVGKVGIGLIALAPMVAIDSGSARADQGGPVTSSEEPLIREPGKEYQVIIDDGTWLANDEIRRLMSLGLYKVGDCIQITEMLDPDSVLTGGDVTYRHLFSRCAPATVPASVPASVPAAPVAPSCVNLEVLLGTAKGTGTDDYIATEEVIVHGDVWINDEFRADSNGATGLIQRVHATPSNPARIHANPLWGGDVAAFRCGPNPKADNEANVAQGVANLQSQGMRADVIDWPGPNELGVSVAPAVAPAVSPAVVNSEIVETDYSVNANWTVNSFDLVNGRFTIISGDGVIIGPDGTKYNVASGNSETGTMVVFSGIGSESLPWGGHIWSGISKGELKTYIESINTQMRKSGCGPNGCSGANTYLWDGTNKNLLTPEMLNALIK